MTDIAKTVGEKHSHGMPDWIRAVEDTGLDWTRDDNIVHVTCFNGLILDVTVVQLQDHDYLVLVSGSDRNGTATNHGMKRVDGVDPDSIRAYIQGIAK